MIRADKEGNLSDRSIKRDDVDNGQHGLDRVFFIRDIYEDLRDFFIIVVLNCVTGIHVQSRYAT